MECLGFEVYRIDSARALELSGGAEARFGYGICELIFVFSGELELSAGGVLCAGEATVLPPHEHISARARGGASVLRISFESTLDDLCSAFGRAVRVSGRGRSLLSLIYSELVGSADSVIDAENIEYSGDAAEYGFGSYTLVKNSLESLLILIVRESQRGEKLPDVDKNAPITAQAHAVRKYIEENYTARISLDSLCFLFRTNKTTICREFKREYGVTVLEYANGLRIREAKRLIAQTEILMTEISDRLGFESVHYFSRLFKKTVGKTPTEYKRSVKARLKLLKKGEI